MAFSGFNSQEQLLQSQNQGGIPSRQLTRSFQQNQPHGMHAFTPHHSQRFAGSFAGYQMEPQMGPHMGPQMGPHMGPQMGPQMGQPHGQHVQSSMVSQMSPHMTPQVTSQMRLPMGPQIGLQMGAFSSNVQMGHQFPKQKQRMLDQQRKITEENQKKQDELMKKKQFEIQQRKLQSLNAKQGVKSINPLNDLFGKKDKGMVPSVAGLIGSLGQDLPSSKPAATSKPSSIIFSRPGGSAAHHSHPNQWGPGFMTSPGQMIPHGSGVEAESRRYNKPADEFGDFEQGPTFLGQNSSDGDFSDFQEALPVATVEGGSFSHSGPSLPGLSNVSGSGAILSQVQGWSGPTAELSRNVPIAGISSSSPDGTFSMAQGTLEMALVSCIQGASSLWSQGSGTLQGTEKTSLINEIPRPRSDSLPGVMPHKYAGNEVGVFQPSAPVNQLNTNPCGDTYSFGGAPSSGGSMPPGMVAPSLGGFVTGPVFHALAIVPPMDAPTTPLRGDTCSVGETETELKQELDPETEETSERKLELLYGITLPDWCVNGTDLPGIYRDVADKTVTLSDAVDTNQLFPILMACDLPRDKLGHIWNQANRAVPGQLNTLELRIVLGLVALGQAGIKTERLTVEKLASCKAAPIPTIPEDLLQSKGRGWSFTETTGGATSAVGQEASLSGETIDPSDKYSVFRTVDQSVVMADSPVSMSAALAVDPNNKHGTPRTFNQHAVQAATLPAEMSSFKGAVSEQGNMWSRPGTKPYKASAGQSFDAQGQHQDFGDFQSETTQHLGSNLNSTTNQVSEFGDFQGQSNLNSKSVSVSIEQDNFGAFHDGTGTDSGNSASRLSSTNIEPAAAFANFQSNTAFVTHTGISQVAKETVVKPQQDDFGDFQSGKESEMGLNVGGISNPLPRQHHRNEQQQQEKQQNISDFGSFQMKGGFDSSCKSSDVGSHNLFSVIQKSNYPASEITTSKNRHSDFGESDDFSEFQQSPTPFSTGGSDSVPSSELASSLEKFKISSQSSYTLERGSLFTSSADSETATRNLSVNNGEGDKKSESNVSVPNFANFPAVPNEPFKASSSEIDSQDDRYSALRDADFSSAGGLFSTVKPLKGETGDDNDDDDDGFHDFGGFEAADEFETNADSNFGAYQSTENLTLTHKSDGSFSALGSSHLMRHSDGNSIAIESSSENLPQEFGDFSTSNYSNSNFADFNLYQGLEASSTSTKHDNIEEFGEFESSDWNNRYPSSLSNSSDTLINSVSLEPTERYKVLSQQSLDVNQHAHAWSRCLNSCLLTLASASLVIEKMTEQSVKKEVLESKEGATYFSAIVEIYKVTARIKASMEKTAPNNNKLKEISQEIERTWSKIVNFLSGSDILPTQSSLDFSKHYVSSTEDGSTACGICLLNVNKTAPGTSKQADGKLTYSGRQYHTTCANFWCNRVDSVLPSLLPDDSLI